MHSFAYGTSFKKIIKGFKIIADNRCITTKSFKNTQILIIYSGVIKKTVADVKLMTNLKLESEICIC